MREAQGSCLNETDGGFHRSSHGIDTRLIAAVERAAAARSHRAAGLLNGYRLWARSWNGHTASGVKPWPKKPSASSSPPRSDSGGSSPKASPQSPRPGAKTHRTGCDASSATAPPHKQAPPADLQHSSTPPGSRTHDAVSSPPRRRHDEATAALDLPRPDRGVAAALPGDGGAVGAELLHQRPV